MEFLLFFSHKYLKKEKAMRIGIKLGSNVLVVKERNFGLVEEVVDKRLMELICQQIVNLIQDGHQVFLVTSGAVACDQNLDQPKKARAAVGQVRLMSKYWAAFGSFGYKPAQLLPTARDLNEPAELLDSMEILLAYPKVVPVVNYNDPMHSSELEALAKFADNDQLFGWLCELAKVQLAIIGFDQCGLLKPNGEVMHRVRLKESELALTYANGGNRHGHGREGMKTKVQVLSRLAGLGIKAQLVPARELFAFRRAVAGEKNFGTIFSK